MIEARELRINSYYKIDKSVSIDQNVFKLDLTDIRANKNICKLINPIPLTPEWLLKLGFKKNEDYLQEEVYENENFQLTNECDNGWFCGNEETHLEIKYVHQLQNLYHALTGKELELK